MKKLSLVIILAFVCSTALAVLSIPPLTGAIVDEVGIMEAGHQEFLEQNLRRLNKQNNVQVQVLVLKSLDGLSIEEASLKVVDEWKLGTAKEDKGMLFLLAPNERRVRIEVGQGLEGDVPDAIAKRIIDQVVTPLFRKGDMSMGVVQGVITAVSYAAPEFQFSDAPKMKSSERGRSRGMPRSWLIILLVIIFIFLRPFGRRRSIGPLGGFVLGSMAGRASRGWGGGGFGGGSSGGWGGGGGGFSGGGASGGW